MMTNATLETLRELKLLGMVRALEEQMAMPDAKSMSFDERLGLLVDREESDRRTRRYKSRIKKAKPRETAFIEDIDFSIPRGLDKGVLLALAGCDWIRRCQNVAITGPAGVGKSYLACALLNNACKEGFTAMYVRVPRLMSDIWKARADGTYQKLMSQLAKTDVLLLDDWALTSLSIEDAREMLEIFEDRHAVRSTIMTSQIPPDKWHGVIPDPTLADAIMDRLIHRAHKIALTGGSVRKLKSGIDGAGQLH